MKGKSINITKLLLFFLFIAAAFNGCGDKKINSVWKTQNIVIDGNDSDWGNSLVLYDDLNALVGIQNDKDFLYICFVTTDQQIQRKVLMTGLTLWFDNAGSNDKKFGIRFPVMKKLDKNSFAQGNDKVEGRRQNSDDGRESGTGESGGPASGLQPGGAPPDKDGMGPDMFKNQMEIEVIDSHNEATRMPISELNGIELKMSIKGSRLVYEIKMPIAMKNNFSYAIGAALGKEISVGVETGIDPNVKLNKIRPPSDENESGNGREGGVGISGGEGSGPEGGGMRSPGGMGGRNSMQQVTKFWFEVKLNTGDSASK